MFRTKKTMLQQWDDLITRYLTRAADEQATATRLDALAGSVVGKWLHRFQLHDRATGHRATAMEYLETVTRMANCPHNPRHGGQGWKPAKRFSEVFTPWDIAFGLLWLGYSLLIGITVTFGLLLIIIGRNRYDPNSLAYVVAVFGAIGAGTWSVMVFQWALQGAAQVTGLAVRCVRGVTR
jgi:hypothetical protein